MAGKICLAFIMKRREFFIKTAGLGSGLFLSKSMLACSGQKLNASSRLIIARNKRLQDKKGALDSDVLLKTLDNTLLAFYNKDNVIESWRQVVRPGEVIGLKVNCLSGRGTTHIELVEAVCERLRQAGIKAQNIIIWDRLNRDLEEAGFRINYRGRGVRCFGNDAAGFKNELETFGSAGSLVSKIPAQLCDGVINLPVLKDHSIAGVTFSLKNMFGAIHNPNKYHLNVGDPYIADVNMLPSLRNKIRLNICDAIEAQYHGGPSFMPQWRWDFNGLLVGADRVALDYTGWQIIEKKRKERGMPSLQEEGRQPTYIATAADAQHKLGTNDPARMEIIRI